MRTFQKAMESNGFTLPSTLLGNLIFFLKWHSVEVAYHNFESIYHQRINSWKKIMTDLHTDWGYGYPQLFEIDGNIEIYFKNPEEALKVLENYSVIYSSNTLTTVMRSFDCFSCVRWIKDIIARAPENCKLVVIRSKLYTPNTMEIRNFNSNVRMNKPYSIEDNGKKVWIAFNPNIPINVKAFGMKRMTSEVEYVV